MANGPRSHRPWGHLHLHRHAHHGAEPSLPDALVHPQSPPQHDILKAREATPSIDKDPSPVELARRSTSTCTDTTSQGCRTGNSAPPVSVAIGLGVAIPLVCALVVFVILHRRHLKKLRKEDLNDPHKSLDFGTEGAAPAKSRKQKKGQEMVGMTDPNLARSLRAGRGLSMDISSPYLLPPEMQGSRESLHSLSRNLTHGAHDPYSPANADSNSLRSTRMREDDYASIRTGSTRQGHRQDGMQQNLLRNASRMSQTERPMVSSPDSMAYSNGTPPPPGQAISPPPPTVSPPGQAANEIDPSSHSIARKQVPLQGESHLALPEQAAGPRESQMSSNFNALRQSNNYLGAFIHSRDGSIDNSNAHATPDGQTAARTDLSPQYGTGNAAGPPVLPSISVEHDDAGEPEPYDVSDLVGPATDGDVESPPDLIPDASPRTENSAFYTPTETPSALGVTGLGVSDVDFPTSRPLSVVRPLPPEDPNDNPEQRANRIRSFYREYFDDNAPARAYKAGSADYYEDYGQEYLGDGAIFDPASGTFIVAGARPYAEPVTRRAMTPPPRGPPRNFRRGPTSSGVQSTVGGPPRARAFSSASAGGPNMGPRGRGPKRQLPPPGPLRTLPTPHLLTEDAFALSIDFAPPSNFRDQQAGRPQSPFMQSRPYSPSVPVATPLASSFSELSAMPSPHQLRKSSTFTALDFAPPPRFRSDGAASDAGSIRSGRSNGSALSTAQMHSMRAGAYRVSRIPKGLVGTRDEFAEALKPSWKVGS